MTGEAVGYGQTSGLERRPQATNRSAPDWIKFDPGDESAYAADLGTDKVVVYEVSADEDFSTRDHVSLHPGAGPRHSAVHPNALVLYVINELDSTLTAFDRDPKTRALTEIETVSTLPEGVIGENFAADVRIHPSGRWAYCSSRGHDSIAIYELNSTSGRAQLVGHESARVEWPWNVEFSPDGSHLFAANHNTDGVVSFQIDLDTGKLTKVGKVSEIPSPSCVTVL